VRSPGLASTARTITIKQHAPRSPAESTLFYGPFALLLFGPLAFGAVEPWSIFVLETGAALLFLLWGFQQASCHELRISGSPLFAPILVFAALEFLQLAGAFTSYRQATFSQALLFECYGLLCFLVVQSFRRTWQVQTLILGLSVYGSLLATLALLQNLTSPNKLYWLRTPHFGSWIYGPYANHNHYAGLMEMLFPVPLVFSLTHYASGASKMMSVLAAAMMATSIFLSGSRGGMMAFTVQIALLAFILLQKRKTFGVVRALGIFATVLLAVLIWLGGGELAQRVASLHAKASSELSETARLNMDRDGIKMFLQKPILGFGLGTFAETYPRYRSFYTNFVVNEAHNDYLQLLVEMGALGFAAMLWFLIVVYRRAITKLTNWPIDTNGAVALATMLGVTGILVHSLVDFNLQIPANAALFYVWCAIAAMEPRFGFSRRGSKSQQGERFSS
jgi:O-antigen ligase